MKVGTEDGIVGYVLIVDNGWMRRIHEVLSKIKGSVLARGCLPLKQLLSSYGISLDSYIPCSGM